MEIERRHVTKAMRLFVPRPLQSGAVLPGPGPANTLAEVGGVFTEGTLDAAKKRFHLVHLLWIIPLAIAAGAAVNIIIRAKRKKLALVSKYKPAVNFRNVTSQSADNKPVHRFISQDGEFSSIHISAVGNDAGISDPTSNGQLPDWL